MTPRPEILGNKATKGTVDEEVDVKHTLTLANVNPYIKSFKAMEYAARGPVIMRAMQLEAELKNGLEKPFKSVTKANLGDAQAMGQKPITFLRQVLASICCPDQDQSFNQDVKDRASSILCQLRGRTAGAYTESRGVETIRRSVASYIERRDGGVPSNPENIVICAGASEGIRACLKLFKNEEGSPKRSGILTPVPEYPLYSATLQEFNMAKISYFLDESNNWGISNSDLEAAINGNKDASDARAIVVINPGNPTGRVLTKEEIESIVRFAYEKRLVILADEVYQDNVYGETKFLSFKKVLSVMPAPYNKTELISFYSTSKGIVCECGLRGGYFEMTNVHPAVMSIIMATAAAKLCPTVLGQAAVSCAVDPPKSGDPSYAQYQAERENILNDLAEKANLVTSSLNALPGIKCSLVQGAMYAYPSLSLPEKALKAAAAANQEPDLFYCLALLEATGMCVVPGSGVGQREGTYHFRTTILPQKQELEEGLRRFGEFHAKFMSTYN